MKSWLIALVSFIAASAQAHDPGLSNAAITCDNERITLHLSFPTADLAPLCPDFTSQAALCQLAAQSIEWQTSTGPAPLTVVSAAQTDGTSLEFSLTAPRSPGRYVSRLLADLPLGHRQVLVLRDSRGETSRIEMLSARQAEHSVSEDDLIRLAPAAPLVQQVEIRSAALLAGVACFIGGFFLHRRNRHRTAVEQHPA
jgi:hypothetical protein